MSGHVFDFDAPVNRRGTNSAKWDTMGQRYGLDDLIHLGVADMDFRSPPAIIEGFQKVVDTGVFGYTDPGDSFFAAIRRWYLKRYQLNVPREWILFCPRINISAGLTVECLTARGDGVMIHTPSYGPLRDAITKYGRRLIASPLIRAGNNFQINFNQMRRDADSRTRLLFLCSPHNPTGRVYSKTELCYIAKFCAEKDMPVFSDEIHGDIVKDGIRHTTMLGLDPELDQRLILASSPAKTFNLPGLVVSYLIVPNPKLREQLASAIDRVGMHNPNVFSVPAVEIGYTQCDEWYEEMKRYIDGNEMFIRRFFSDNLPGFTILDREGTYLLWIDYTRLGKSEKELRSWLLNRARVGLYMGSTFGIGGEGYLRLNMAASRSLLEQALGRMRDALPVKC